MTSQRGVFDFLRSRGEEFINQVTNELMGNPRFIKAMQAAMRGKEWFDQAVAQAMKTMNVPTRTEFKRAVARIDALEQELAELRRAAAARTKASSAARKKAARKRKARKKSARPAPLAALTETEPSSPAE